MRARPLTACLCAWTLAMTLTSGAARADEPRTSTTEARRREHETYSPYEKSTIESAIEQLDTEVDHNPEGKAIERVDIVTLEVIEKRDPAPGFLNWFHWTTRPYVIEREILLGVGDRYREALVDETARNLRALRRLSLVLCFAAKGSRPDRVRLVVITKDTWSLRLNTDFRFAGGGLEALLIQPSEENIFGTHNSIALQVTVNPASYSIGGRYSMPHIGGSLIRFSADANVIMNRELERPEGSYGSFRYGQPLYTLGTKWAWGATISWRDEIFRRFCPKDNVTPCTPDDQLRAFDAESTEAVERIPFSYRSDLLAGQDYVTRSFGKSIKHDIAIGVEVSRRRFVVERPPLGPDLTEVDPMAVAEFVQRVLPLRDTRVGPFVQYQTYSTRFMHVLDFETLGLTEDVSLGHNVVLKVTPVSTAIGSTRSYVSLYAAGRYSVALGDGMAIAFAESSTDIATDSLPDASIEAGGRVITPRLGFGRLVVDARVLHRYRDYLNRASSLGGNTRLRGYPTQAFLGKDVVSANLEFRTRPIEILSCQLGGVAFFDAGDAFDGAKDLRLQQSAGFGLRILFPQFDRTVMRADWGFPLTRGYREPDGLPGDIVVTFRQAFPIPDIPTSSGID